jgi:hypothetical protein
MGYLMHRSGVATGVAGVNLSSRLSFATSYTDVAGVQLIVG